MSATRDLLNQNRAQKNIKSWISWIVSICISLAVCAVAINMLNIRLRYERDFQELEGKLVAVNEFPEDRGFWRSPHFTFRSNSGELIEFKTALGHIWLNYSVLDKVTILYDPQSKEAVMAGFEELYVPVLFFAFSGIVLLGVFLLFPLLVQQYISSRNGVQRELKKG